MTDERRYARLHYDTATLAADDIDAVRRYLPANYGAYREMNVDGSVDIVIAGVDRYGWTLDDYVLPRLASGNRFAKEDKQ